MVVSRINPAASSIEVVCTVAISCWPEDGGTVITGGGKWVELTCTPTRYTSICC